MSVHEDVSGRWAAPGVDTPALVVDLETCQRNVAAMAAHAAGHVALRPHAKTHKSPAVAALQLAAGAVGLSVATVGEAEVFADHGASDLFIAYPVWAGGDTGPRLAALASKCRIAVGADSVAAVERLGRVVGAVAAGPGAVGADGNVAVLVEVDCGLGRTGVAPAEAGAIATAATAAGLAVAGVFTFPGHSYKPGGTPAAIADEAKALSEAAAAVEAAGLPCPVRSGGSTPTAAATAGGVVTELRPGIYVFNDAQQVVLGTCQVTDLALAAVATVVSSPSPERVVLDTGSKVLASDRSPWMDGHGLLPAYRGARVVGLWEHHAVVDTSALPPSARPRLGDRVAVVPNHVCTAVNLASVLHVVSGGRVVDHWEVAARGANR